MAFARSLISDLALDVLLYQSSYREEISRVVVAETNRIVKLFRERNPEFKGKVHLMGHSLGSAIFFDVLCRQRERRPSDETIHPLRVWPTSHSRPDIRPKDEELDFDFDTHDFYCLGSPVGLFQMLQGRYVVILGAFPMSSFVFLFSVLLRADADSTQQDHSRPTFFQRVALRKPLLSRRNG